MREPRNDGGPAFPFHIDKAAVSVEDFGGMTLRDYFAAQALVAIVPTAAAPCLYLNEDDCALCARTSYALADAMLAERAK